jgi:predicted transcriptional regulator
MKAVTIELLPKAKSRLRGPVRTRTRRGTVIGFPNAEMLWKAIRPKRWQILRAMMGAGPLTIREVSRRVKRDVKLVHADVHVMLDAGIIEHTTTGQVILPFDAIHIDFTLRAV